MSIQYFVPLDNEYEFKHYCAQKSLEVFDTTIKNNLFPSRFNFLRLLLTEAVYSPFYLVTKLAETMINIFHILPAVKDMHSLQVKKLSLLTKAILLQSFLPLNCVAIRICASIAGLLYPYWAVQGWKLAEKIECLFFSVWSNLFREWNCQRASKLVYEEILPANAIFYLGEKQVRLSLKKGSSAHIEEKIALTFFTLLQTIVEDRESFLKLLDYDKAIHSKTIGKNEVAPYRLNHDTKSLLMQLKPCMIEDAPLQSIIEQIRKEMSTKDILILFYHIYFNLRVAFLEDELNLDQTKIEDCFTQLKDLFSQQFQFGRAHFFSSFYFFLPPFSYSMH